MNYTGFLNVYKEKGMTSMSVCARIRRILHVDKVGHAGTLDPMAEGVLPVALGRACKSVEDAGQGIKTYEAGMLLGTVTDTQDITGTVLSSWEKPLPPEEEIRRVIAGFEGGYDQLTPMYSARQVDGRRLYDIARSGETVERETKHIDIRSIRILSMNLPHVRFVVECSKGTYVRTICHDIGERLGCGACMESLIRTKVGDFEIGDTLGFRDLEALEAAGTVDTALRVITPTAVAIGKFDGTHIGHQLLLRELRKTAEKQRLRSLVLLVRPEEKSIEAREEHRDRLLSMGIDYVIELPLTEELMQMSAEDFLRDVLLKKCCMKYLVGGTDIAFGYQKQGNAAFLAEKAGEYGFHYRLIEKLELQKGFLRDADAPAAVSSSLVREYLSRGDMETVRRLMGTFFTLRGTVIRGRHLGTDTLETATANIAVSEDRQLPPYGVYVSRVTVSGKEDRKVKNDLTAPKGKGFDVYYGISDLGRKPSINGGTDPLSLETHILTPQVREELYGREIQVELLHFLREERKFDSLEDLKEQILTKDIPAAEQYISDI